MELIHITQQTSVLIPSQCHVAKPTSTPGIGFPFYKINTKRVD